MFLSWWSAADVGGSAQVGWGDPGRHLQHADLAGGTGGHTAQPSTPVPRPPGHSLTGQRLVFSIDKSINTMEGLWVFCCCNLLTGLGVVCWVCCPA